MRPPSDVTSLFPRRSTSDDAATGRAGPAETTPQSFMATASASPTGRETIAGDGAIRLLVIDDHPLFRHGIARALASEPDVAIVGFGETAADAIRLVGLLLPNVVVLDLNLPGGGIGAIEAIRARYSEVRVLVLTVEDDRHRVTAAMQAGAHGYLLKGVSGRELAETLRLVHRGNLYLPPELGARLLGGATRPPPPSAAPSAPFAGLTPRERQIGLLVSQGLSNREVGFKLDLTENTVKHYLTEIMRKLNLRNRVQLALLGSQQDHGPTSEAGASGIGRGEPGTFGRA